MLLICLHYNTPFSRAHSRRSHAVPQLMITNKGVRCGRSVMAVCVSSAAGFFLFLYISESMSLLLPVSNQKLPICIWKREKKNRLSIYARRPHLIIWKIAFGVIDEKCCQRVRCSLCYVHIISVDRNSTDSFSARVSRVIITYFEIDCFFPDFRFLRENLPRTILIAMKTCLVGCWIIIIVGMVPVS